MALVVGGASSAAARVIYEAPPSHHIRYGLPVQQVRKAPPAPAPAPSAVAAGGGGLSSSQVATYSAAAGFPASLVPAMVQIAWRESRFDPGAVNASSGACGLWQLYPCPGSAALDPQANAWYAREKCLDAVAAGGSCLDPWGG